jgi:hypothetical protein
MLAAAPAAPTGTHDEGMGLSPAAHQQSGTPGPSGALQAAGAPHQAPEDGLPRSIFVADDAPVHMVGMKQWLHCHLHRRCSSQPATGSALALHQLWALIHVCHHLSFGPCTYVLCNAGAGPALGWSAMSSDCVRAGQVPTSVISRPLIPELDEGKVTHFMQKLQVGGVFIYGVITASTASGTPSDPVRPVQRVPTRPILLISCMEVVVELMVELQFRCPAPQGSRNDVPQPHPTHTWGSAIPCTASWLLLQVAAAGRCKLLDEPLLAATVHTHACWNSKSCDFPARVAAGGGGADTY